ncbi:MAG: FTR1 family protein [Thermoanaerobaculia bacterium]
MWQGFTIALREGIESFLIVALTFATLRRSGREHLVRAVVLGIAASVALCTVLGILLQRVANKSLWEGILAGISTLLVGSLLVYMLRSARTMKADLERRIQRAAGESGQGGFWGVFLFTVLMITREGMETALLVVTTSLQMKAAAAPFVSGLLLGLLGAAAVAFTWTRLGRGVNIGILLNISAFFLAIFLLQLCLYTVHELSEAGVLPNSQAIHDATEIFGPDGRLGAAMTYLLAIAPTSWLLWAWFRRREAVPAESSAVASLPPRAS